LARRIEIPRTEAWFLASHFSQARNSSKRNLGTSSLETGLLFMALAPAPFYSKRETGLALVEGHAVEEFNEESVSAGAACCALPRRSTGLRVDHYLAVNQALALEHHRRPVSPCTSGSILCRNSLTSTRMPSAFFVSTWLANNIRVRLKFFAGHSRGGFLPINANDPGFLIPQNPQTTVFVQQSCLHRSPP